jgi:hypothetical protein
LRPTPARISNCKFGRENDASSSNCSAALSGDATGQNFVNAAAIEIDDLETPTVAVKTFADLRQMPKLIEHESGSRMIAAVRRKGDCMSGGNDAAAIITITLSTNQNARLRSCITTTQSW